MLNRKKSNRALNMLVDSANGQKRLSICKISQIYLRQIVSQTKEPIVATIELV